jgi:hypothetical protein
VKEPLPPDAFRPAYCDRQAKIYFARDLKRDLLPTAAVGQHAPDVKLYTGFTQKPWVATGFFAFEQPIENMPMYGREYGRVVGLCALTLCTDLKPEQKEPLLINFVQVGIDLGGMIRAGHPGFEGFGGHGSGRKLPIVFAGILLGDEEFANVNKSFPQAAFGEDEQSAYGDTWTGAKVVFAGHRGIDAKTGIARERTGPYENKPPKDWTEGDKTSEGYRRCCTSTAWVPMALALRLMKAEKQWNHDAFFDYCDRWMYEDDKAALAEGQGHRHRLGPRLLAPWPDVGGLRQRHVGQASRGARHAPHRRLEEAPRRQLPQERRREGQEGREGRVAAESRHEWWHGFPTRAAQVENLCHPLETRNELPSRIGVRRCGPGGGSGGPCAACFRARCGGRHPRQARAVRASQHRRRQEVHDGQVHGRLVDVARPVPDARLPRLVPGRARHRLARRGRRVLRLVH